MWRALPAGSRAAITYLNDKARPYVEPLARELDAPIFLPLNVQQEGQLEAVFEQIRRTWGRLDIALHWISVCSQGRPAGRPARLFPGGLPHRGRCLLPLVHPDGQAGGTTHDPGGHSPGVDVPGIDGGRAQLQRDGAGQGGTRIRRTISGSRAGSPGRPGARDLTRAGVDSRPRPGSRSSTSYWRIPGALPWANSWRSTTSVPGPLSSLHPEPDA